MALPDGTFRGGPAFYIERGLGSQRWGVVFALLLIFTFGLQHSPGQRNCGCPERCAHRTDATLRNRFGASGRTGFFRRNARFRNGQDPLERIQPATRKIILLFEPPKLYNIMTQGFICWAFGLHECAGLKNAQLFFARRTPKLTPICIEAFSLREAAQRAGVSPEAPAHHFGSAKGLLTEVAFLVPEEHRYLAACVFLQRVRVVGEHHTVSCSGKTRSKRSQ